MDVASLADSAIAVGSACVDAVGDGDLLYGGVCTGRMWSPTGNAWKALPSQGPSMEGNIDAGHQAVAVLVAYAAWAVWSEVRMMFGADMLAWLSVAHLLALLIMVGLSLALWWLVRRWPSPQHAAT